MNHEDQSIVDINTADKESLSKLSGIGERLAERIIDARPFQSLDELTRVRGISENDVDRLRSYLTISNAIEDPQIQYDVEHNDETSNIEMPEIQEGSNQDSSVEVLESEELKEVIDQGSAGAIEEIQVSSSDDIESDSLKDLEQEDEFGQQIERSEDSDLVEEEGDKTPEIDPESSPEESDQIEAKPSEKPDTKTGYITRGGACSLILIGGFLTTILAVAITLGILSSINQGQLDYASPSQVASLQSQVEVLASKSQSLTDDINSMRARIDNLESLTGQVSEMEIEIIAMTEEIDQLQTQMEANQAAFDDMTLQIEDIQEEIEILSTQGDRFESFLDGMRALLEELFPQTQEIEETP